MKNIGWIFLFFLIITSSKAQTKKHPTTVTNDYKSILEDKFVSIINKDTFFINEIKYVGVHTGMLTKKIMYDKFGKWSREIYPKQKRHPLLVWDEIELFPKHPIKFTIITQGAEGLEGARKGLDKTYASIMIFDKKNQDLLSENSEYKAKLIDYFSDLIKSNDYTKKEFYKIYWNTVDPNAWKRINKYKN